MNCWWKRSVADFIDYTGNEIPEKSYRLYLFPGGMQSPRDCRQFDYSTTMFWIQRRITLPPFAQGIWKITPDIIEAIPEIQTIETGLLHLFLQHTSASLTINENADSDVPGDLNRLAEKLAPESFPYHHTCEGADDMPAHVKSSLFGVSLSIPVGNGRLLLGMWQGVFLCEHRRRIHRRTLVMTLFGQKNELNS